MIEELIVGVAVVLRNNKGQILLGLRKSGWGDKTWAPPGGKIEQGESIKRAACRELAEETSIIIQEKDLSLIGITTNHISERKRRHISLFMRADSFSGSPKIMEADKCEKWEWFDVDKQPEQLFTPWKIFLENHRQTLKKVVED